jgi:acetyl esterase
MPVDPLLEPILANYPLVPEHIEDYAALRAQDRAGADALIAVVGEPGPEVRERRRVSIEVEDGAIDLLIYQPFSAAPNPLHLFLHGGGWVTGSIDHAHVDAACRERCVGADCVVVSVDYRKAPEHRFPTALQDCHTALRWVVEHADELGVRADLLTVGGQSAGGNLAAALALKVRDEGGPALAFQLLEVPALDLTFSGASYQQFGTGYALALSDVQFLRRDYLESIEQATHPYVSPLLAPDLSGLAPAHIMTAEYDVLRDDGAAYARRLADAGVPVSHTMHEGHVHISSAATKLMASARAWRGDALDALRRACTR